MLRALFFFMLSVVVPFTSFAAVQSTKTVESEILQQRLKRNRATWVAGRTAVSDLSRAERVVLLGASLAEVRTDGDYGRRTKVLEDALPEVFDWRDRDGKNYVTPVKNQGRCGSCVAFAAASTLETQMNIATDSVQHVWGFSPQHLFSCGGGSCNAGWFPGSAVDFLVDDGVPEEACFPYTSGAVGSDVACKKTCKDSKVRSTKTLLRTRSKRFRGASVDDVKRALIAGPLITSMRVYDDFYSYKSGIYKHQEGALLGGHAVMIVGWNNSEQAWIARNSWGTDWGEAGDFRIAWDDISGVGGSFYGVEASEGFAAVVLEGVRDAQTIRQPLTMKMRLHNVTAASGVLEVVGTGKTLISKPFNSSGELIFDPAEFADGIYTIQIRVQNSDSSAQQRVSQARLVYVRNSAPSATIKIERMKANMNVWETIVPHFVVTSRPVPLAYVQYRLLDGRGNEVRLRKTEHTADRVAMSLSPRGLVPGPHVIIAEAVSDEGVVLASDRLEFNITEK